MSLFLGAAGLIPYLTEFMTTVPKLIELGTSAASLASHVSGMVTKGGPTDADWTALHGGEDAMRSRLQAGAAPRPAGT